MASSVAVVRPSGDGMSASWGDRHVVFSRVIYASPETVFRAWTDASLLPEWWGPIGFTNPVCNVDLRVGGAWRVRMRSADGSIYPSSGTYLEIAPPDRLVMTNAFVDTPNPPVAEMLMTVTFAPRERDTMLAIRTEFQTIRDRYTIEGMRVSEGWAESLVKLNALVTRGA